MNSMGQKTKTNKWALITSLMKSNRYCEPNTFHQSNFTTVITPQSEAVDAFNKVVDWQNTTLLPPTWLQVAAMPLYMNIITQRDFPYSPLGLVHVENRISIFKPLNRQEQYEVHCYADNFRAHRKGQLFDLIVKATVSGELVYQSIASNLAFLKNVEAVEEKRHFESEATFVDEIADFGLSSDTGRRYAAVSGDYNLIHLSPLPAKLFGFKRHIAHGMYLKARALSALDEAGKLLQDNVEVGIKFIKPVFLPGKVRLYTQHVEGNLYLSLESANRKTIHSLGEVSAIY